MISLNKCRESFNVLSPKIFVLKETKKTNIKGFNMQQTKINLKQWQNTFHVIVNANSIVQHVIQNKNGIINYVNVNVKIIISAKKLIV